MHGARAGLVAVLLTAYAAAAAEPGLTQLEAGVSAYRSGDYVSALAAFLDAQQRGLDTPKLHFNLGLSYYQLGRHGEARVEFERLQGYEAYRPLADFHLALVLARQGERARAEALLLELIGAAPQDALRERARVALARLDPEASGPAFSAYVLAGIGHDSNPGLFDDADLPPEGRASNSLEMLATYSHSFTPAAPATTVLRGGAYVLGYQADNGLDQSGLYAGLGRERVGSARRRAYSVEASTSQLDGDRFVDTLSADVVSAPLRGASGFALRSQLTYLETPDDLTQLRGWRLRGDLEWILRRGSGRLRTVYQAEANERRDLRRGDEFFSNSPLRQRFDLLADHAFGARWRLEWGVRYRHSWYRHRDRIQEGGTTREERRVEHLAQGMLQLRRSLGSDTSALLDYEYSLNAATIDRFDYERHAILLGLEWLPVSH